MIRLIGSILVAGGMAAAGLSAVKKLSVHVAALSSMINALEIMQLEICFRLTPIPETVKMLAATAEGPAREFFADCRKRLDSENCSSFQETWNAALREDECMGLSEQERQIISDLGPVLGRYDAEGQEKALGYARRRLEAFLTRAELERGRQGKVYGTLGAVLGILAVIIMI